MILKLIGILVFMMACVVGGLWVTLELAGALAEGSEWVWYLALALAVIPAIVFVILAARSRSLGSVLLTVAASALLLSVLLTYPSGSVACGPDAEAVQTVDTSSEDLGGILADDDGADTGSSATDCP